jgi:tetratricopeptide (TPR) repeat protein
MKNTFAALLLLLSLTGYSQERQDKDAKPAAAPAAKTPETQVPAPPAKPLQKTPNKSAAYYHYTMAHMYEELLAIYGRSEYANRAIQEYRLAIENDPNSEYLNSGLAELYAKTGRIRDAVLEAQEILKRDPNNLEARKLLGRIYLRSLGDPQAGSQSQEMLKLAIEQFEAIIRIQPKSVDDRLLLGRLYRLNNELLKAENEFKTAVQLQPQGEDAVTSLAYLYNEEGDSKRAIEVLSRIPEAQRTSKVYAALGYSYEQLKQYKQAIAAYKKSVELDQDNLDSMRGLAQNLMNDGQTEAALAQYTLIADADPKDAQAFLRMAEIHRRGGKFDLALATLKKAALLVQDSLEVPYNTALVYEAQGRFEEAAQLIQQLLQKTAKADGNYNTGERNNRTVFLERLGNVYRQQGKTQLALETFRKILELGTDNAARGYQQMIDLHREAKQWNEATAVAQEAVNKLPNDRGLKMVLAGQLADSGKVEQAVARVKEMLKGTAADREVYIAMAQMYSRLRRWKEAEAAAAEAQRLSDTDDEREYVNFVLGSIYERQKKYDLAEQAFKKTLAADPNNAVALNYLGYMLADRGVRLEEALGYVKRAIEIDPHNGAYLDSLGWAYFKLGKYDLAEENLRRAAERITNDATIQDHLGDLYHKTGRLKLAAGHWERALEEWKRTVAAEVDNEEVAKVQKKLEAARVKLAQQAGVRK